MSNKQSRQDEEDSNKDRETPEAGQDLNTVINPPQMKKIVDISKFSQ